MGFNQGAASEPLFYTPSREDNLEIYSILSSPSLVKPLPPELAIKIVDYAEKWSSVFATSLDTQDFQVPDVTDEGRGDKIVLSSPELTPKKISSIRKIVFKFTSKDQGRSWYSGNYGYVWTWFDAVLLNDSPPIFSKDESFGATVQVDVKKAEDSNEYKHLPLGDRYHNGRAPRKYRVAHNKHTGCRWENYTIELYKGHDIYDDMVEGDRLVLMACARSPAWANVRSASLEIWAADDLSNDTKLWV
ncbi:hypothetical protein MMC12_005893 [Toensbergia leucococca]|nr:hypothetical protein [Toensbergia leucococca]